MCSEVFDVYLPPEDGTDAGGLRDGGGRRELAYFPPRVVL